ncbi:PD-(D/E)XK nuclease family protein [Methanobrevibacter sp. OttesenSCG-928-I08]|nr:PD-(D/E)XK nuclease family protein [Methanobrevibacter sp. OttesenSCG-928-I08]
MKLSARTKAYMIPEYSLTGDLLSFLTCNLQYRYQNKGTLPPSMPIQLWFGEFIHGIMEESYIKWENGQKEFPWDWKTQIRPIEDMIDLRLQVRGLYPPPTQFYSTVNEENVILTDDHERIASARAIESINKWGPHLFPLIDSAEVLIKGIRDMPNYDKDKSRSNYYGINGVIDVLSSININELLKEDESENKIINYLKNNKHFMDNISSLKDENYEVIIDYKGMKRPSLDSSNWIHHKWQILTYAWLRQKQEESSKVIAGIIFYLNELVPSTEDMVSIQTDINGDNTDVTPNNKDYDLIMNWDEDKKVPDLSDKFKMDRSIRIINIEDNNINNSLNEFDKVVNKIEDSLIKEMNGCKIKEAWKSDGEERTCKACDFRTFCNNKKNSEFKVP